MLCWLRKSTNSLKTLVANRVHAIRNLVPNAQWRHISQTSNPADLTSRGLHAEALIKSSLWWEGPHWIKQPISSWTKLQFHLPDDIPESKAVILAAPASIHEKPWDKYSDFSHTLRVISWCRRFIRNCTTGAEDRNKNTHLQAEEVSSTKDHLLSLEQKEHFPEAFKALQRGVPLPKGHAFRKYKVTKSSTGLLLLSTRIRDFRDARQPRKLIPLSIKSTLTKRLLSSLN